MDVCLESLLNSLSSSSESSFEPETPHKKRQLKKDEKEKAKQIVCKSPKAKRRDESGQYTFTPVLSSQRKVPINQTDFTRIGEKLDVTKDVPIKKNQSAYVLFGNEVSVSRR